MHRRRFLRVAAATTTISLAGCSEDASDGGATDSTTEQHSSDPTTRAPTSATEPSATPTTRPSSRQTTRAVDETTATTTDADETSTTARETTAAGDDSEPERADFVWAEQSIWRDERTRENLFAYASRHDFAVVLAQGNVNRADIGERLAKPLAAARDRGVAAWVNTGILSEITPETFVNDAEARATHLDRLGRAASTYAEHVRGGRVIVWQEAPVGGEWVKGGAWNDAALSNLRELGPQIFAAQKEAIAEAAPELDVGIFVHFPYIVDSKKPAVFAGLIDDLRDRDALPEFVFADFYRGWYEKDAGPAVANRAVRSLITNAREHTGGEVLYMGGAHTINPRHTPSKQAIRLDLRASTSVDADGLGWYARTAYQQTERGFDPFVPNRADAERVPDTPRANTTTFARDRYQYAYAALRETRAGYDPTETFDLWLVGEDFSLYDHRLSARTRNDTWGFVGDFGGYVDGSRRGRNADTTASQPHVSIFRGLDRERFLSTGDLDLVIETRSESTGATLRSILVTPSGTGGYLAEPAAARLLAERGTIDAFALGETRVDAALNPGDSIRVGLSVGERADRPFRALRYPAYATAIEQLWSVETRENLDPGTRFDVWIEASGLDAISHPEARLYVPRGSSDGDSRVYLENASATITTTANGAVAYGLARDALLDRMRKHGIGLDIDGARTPTDRTTTHRTPKDADASLRAAYAMAYFGSRNFVPAARAVETIAADRAEARTFSLHHVQLD